MDKLKIVRPLKTRYFGDIGDVVIGRVSEIANKKWKIDIQGFEYAYLHINAVKLEEIQVALPATQDGGRRDQHAQVHGGRRPAGG